MKTAAIICEYNPFHNGHLYHIEETKRILGADYIIALMSGNYVQRGGPAVIEKKTRARMALMNGAERMRFSEPSDLPRKLSGGQRG